MPHNICVVQPFEADEYTAKRDQEMLGGAHAGLAERIAGRALDHGIHEHVSARDARVLTGFESFAGSERAGAVECQRRERVSGVRFAARWIGPQIIAMRSYGFQVVSRPGEPSGVQFTKRGI